MKRILKSLSYLYSSRNPGDYMKKHDLNTDLMSRRKSILYRSSNLGMLELDLLVGKFARNNF